MKRVQFYDYSSRAAGNTNADPQQAETANGGALTEYDCEPTVQTEENYDTLV